MLNFNEGICQVLAQDTRNSLADIDRSIGSKARMIGTIVDTFEGAQLPAVRAQSIFRRAHAALGHIIEGRGEVASMISELQVLQRHSNVKEVSFGCTAPWDAFTTAEKTPENEVARAS